MAVAPSNSGTTRRKGKLGFPCRALPSIASSLLGVFSPLAYVFGPVLRLADALLSS